MYNTTESLILAWAVKIFGIHQTQKIEAFLKANTDANSEIWVSEYQRLCRAAASKNITSLISYCENERLELLEKMHKKIILIRNLVLEKKLRVEKDPWKPLPLNFDYEGIFGCPVATSIPKVEYDKLYEENFTKYSHQDKEFRILKRKKEGQIAAKRTERLKSESNIKHSHVVEQPQDIKKSPQYVFQRKKAESVLYGVKNAIVQSSEKNLDDVLTEIDNRIVNDFEFRYHLQRNQRANRFPASAKVRNLEHRRIIVCKAIREYRANKKDSEFNHAKPVSSKSKIIDHPPEKLSPIEIQYNSICEKIQHKRKEGKNRLLWVDDLKTCIHMLIFVMQKDELCISKTDIFRKFINSINRDSPLSNTIFSALMLIQDVYFTAQNLQVSIKVASLKRNVGCLYDYYKK